MPYELPKPLEGKCSLKDYNRWLRYKAVAHVKRDKKRGNTDAKIPMYREAIHKAVCNGGDRDAYTGRPLRWDLISTYDNKQAKAGKKAYKKKFADLPTVDHQGEGQGHPQFRICSWRTNDCKSDLTLEELTDFCECFLEFQRTKNAMIPKNWQPSMY